MTRCVRRRAFSDEAIADVLRNGPMDSQGDRSHTHRQLDLSHRPELVMVSDGIRPAALYDRLRHTVSHDAVCEDTCVGVGREVAV